MKCIGGTCICLHLQFRTFFYTKLDDQKILSVLGGSGCGMCAARIQTSLLSKSLAAPHSGLWTSLLLSASWVFLKWVSRCWREREEKMKRAVEEEEEEEAEGEKNSQSKLFSLQCGLIGEIEKWRKEAALVWILEAVYKKRSRWHHRLFSEVQSSNHTLLILLTW